MARRRYEPDRSRTRIARAVLDGLDVTLYINHDPAATESLRWLARRYAARPSHPVPFMRGLFSVAVVPYSPEDSPT